MSEKSMQTKVKLALTVYEEGLLVGDCMPVKNPLLPGTPDLNWVYRWTEGWIELKRLPCWPKGGGTIVRLEHFTPQQRVWLRRRARFGRATLLLRIEGSDEWLLFDGEVAADLLGKAPRQELYDNARLIMDGMVPEALREELCAR